MKKLLLLIGVLGLCACAGAIDPSQVSPFERRSIAAMGDDLDIQADFYDEVHNEPELSGQTHVTATAFNGILLLTGEAATERLRDLLVRIAQMTDNVKRVHNNIVIAYPSGLDSRQRDLRITADVTDALKQIRTLPNFDSSQVKVVTANGVVYLMGLLHQNEGAVVINVVRYLPDVKQIVAVFEYLD